MTTDREPTAVSTEPAQPEPAQPEPAPDPRPLLGEPLGLDLLDTHWIEGGSVQDLLGTIQGAATFLRSARLGAPGVPDGTRVPPADEAVRAALCTARDVVQAVAEHPGDPGARAAFNALLSRGRRDRRLGADGAVVEHVHVEDPAWLVAWLAADDYLRLVATAPDRIRRCEHERCILWFHDTTRGGTRRWCSMAVCGNRAKAERHYRRRATGDTGVGDGPGGAMMGA